METKKQGSGTGVWMGKCREEDLVVRKEGREGFVEEVTFEYGLHLT